MKKTHTEGNFMLKMFTTQLTGLLGRIQTKQEESFEDAARLLAQAVAGQGTIYIFGTNEMAAVELEAVNGAEPMQNARIWDSSAPPTFSAADRALIISRFSSDPKAIEAARLLAKEGIPYVAVCTVDDEGGTDFLSLAHVHIDLFLKKGLLPDEIGGRHGYPSSIAALYVYYGLKFIIEEILAEYEN